MKKLTFLILLLISAACHAQKQTIIAHEGDTITYSPYKPKPVIPPPPTYIVKTADWKVDGASIAPGTIITISGNRSSLLFTNLKGTPEKPIIIKMDNAIISVPQSNSYGLKTQNCQFFKVQNGEVIGGNIGVTFDDLSSDFEVSGMNVHGQAFAGIMAKTDPTSDKNTQRGNFTLYNPIFHDNYVHDTGGEGFYIGNSFYQNGVNGFLPHDVIGAKVYNNKTERTGCEGIQVGGGVSGTDIYGNTVISPGQNPFAAGQSNGIQIGEGTGGKCHDNTVKNAPGNGIIVLGLGDNVVYSNLILNSGENGIFADSRYTPKSSFSFINNTIVTYKNNGIKLNSTTIPQQNVINNIIIGNGNYFMIAGNKNLVNNFTNGDVNAAGFVDPANGDYRLKATSGLNGKGVDVSGYGVKGFSMGAGL